MNDKTYYRGNLLILYLVFFFLLDPLLSQTKIDIKELVGFENFISNEIKEGEIAGAEVLIFKNNNIIWHKNLGYRNYSSN